MIPTVEECNRLLDEYKIPGNMRRHVEMVRKISVLLANALKEKGENINVDLVDRGARLHDLARAIHFDTDAPSDAYEPLTEEQVKFFDELREKFKGIHHGVAGREILEEKYPEVANIVGKHGSYNILNGHLKTWEEKLVFYADKRVLHDKIVTLEERYEDSKKRHGHSENQDISRAAVEKLEKEIFNKLDFGPEELKGMIENE